MQYVVMNEHTLGYMIDADNMGVLCSNVLFGAPFELWPGPKYVRFSTVRPAAVADFQKFRVKVPPDMDKRK